MTGRRLQAIKHVVDVVAPRTQMCERRDRFTDLDGVSHRCQSQQGFKFCIYIETFDAELGRCLGERALLAMARSLPPG